MWCIFFCYIDSIIISVLRFLFFFFFNDTATTEIYTLSLHDALPIYVLALALVVRSRCEVLKASVKALVFTLRSEERFSRNAETDLVCRLLLEKKKKDKKSS